MQNNNEFGQKKKGEIESMQVIEVGEKTETELPKLSEKKLLAMLEKVKSLIIPTRIFHISFRSLSFEILINAEIRLSSALLNTRLIIT
jgi:hypothetical protein